MASTLGNPSADNDMSLATGRERNAESEGLSPVSSSDEDDDVDELSDRSEILRQGQVLWIRGLSRLQTQVGLSPIFTNNIYMMTLNL